MPNTTLYNNQPTDSQTVSGDHCHIRQIPTAGRCRAVTKIGLPCRGSPVAGSDRCPSHHNDYRMLATGPISPEGLKRSAANLPSLAYWLENIRNG